MDKYENISAVPTKREEGLELFKEYKVASIVMGQSHTSVYLENDERPYNSILFDFYDGYNKIDIYKDFRFNPYIKHGEVKV